MYSLEREQKEWEGGEKENENEKKHTHPLLQHGPFVAFLIFATVTAVNMSQGVIGE